MDSLAPYPVKSRPCPSARHRVAWVLGLGAVCRRCGHVGRRVSLEEAEARGMTCAAQTVRGMDVVEWVAPLV